MKKNFFLTLMLAVLCTATSWAQFSPKEGTPYALKLTGTELYMDVQTLGRTPNGVDNNISLSVTPTTVFFEKETDGWSIKNARGNYITVGSEPWNPAIKDAYGWCDWIIKEPEVGIITIQYPWGEKPYIGTDDPKNECLLWCSRPVSDYVRFQLIEYSQLKHFEYALKTEADTYLNINRASSSSVETPLVADGVYTISNTYNGRGTLAYGKYNGTEYFGLADVTLSGYEDRDVTVESDVNKYWYVITHKGKTYFYNIGKGLFLQNYSAVNATCASTVSKGFTITERTANSTKYFSVKDGSYNLSCSCGYNPDEGDIRWLQSDEEAATLFSFNSVDDAETTYAAQIAAAKEALGISEQLISEGVYSISGDQNSRRGYMAFCTGYDWYPVLTGITYDGYQGNSAAVAQDGQYWYVTTRNGGVSYYVYNVAKGKFLANKGGNIDFSDDPYTWTIKQNGNYTSLYDNSLGKYLSMACGTSPTQDRNIKWDTNKDDGGAQHTFTKLEGGTSTFAAQIAAANAAIPMATFGTEPSLVCVYPSGDGIIIKDEQAGVYVGATHEYNVTGDFSMWKLTVPNNEGYMSVVRYANNDMRLGSSANTNAGTGLYTNVGSSCNTWRFEGSMDYETKATSKDDNYEFKSEKIFFAAPCNVLRFTLSGSAAYYKNNAKRLSFDKFVLYNAYGEKVALKPSNFTANNITDFNGMLDGEVNDACSAGAWDSSSATDDWFEINLAKIDLGGAFSFEFVTENNTNMNVTSFCIEASFEEIPYTFAITNPTGKDVTVTYDDDAVAVGDEFYVKNTDLKLFTATDISGYTWKIVVDNEKRTITLVYTAVQVTENPKAVVELIKRVGGEDAAGLFKFVLDPSMNSKNDVFVIGCEDDKVLIKGTTISAITTGIGWYLNNYAHINIAWNSLNEKTVSGDAYADLSDIPVPTGTETRTCDAVYRYYLNTCTFGYSMTSWTWKRWQQEIDWMALHGINMPLQLVGMEEVWRKFLTMEENGQRKYGYTDAEAKAFVAGPAFIAWWAMNNLEGWGGTGVGSKSGYNNLAGAGGVQDDAWYERQKALAKQITDRQRELGMQPVLPGWSGMVPTNFASKSGFATRGNGNNWAGDFVRPLLLSVSNANYAAIAADYYKCLHEVMGESQYYSMDPFHEGGGAGTMEDYKALYAAMEAAKPGSQWVIQQWQWSETQKYSLTAVPAGRLIVLDLFSDGSPAFDGYNGYAPQDAVFCAIPNFGGRSGLMGRLNNVTDNYFKFKGKYASIKGIGTAPEAIEQTPVAYDLIYQLPWMGTKPDVAEWVRNYSIARYGIVNAEVQAAWELLRQGPLNYGADGIQGPVEDVWAARPNLSAKEASAWGATISRNWNGTIVAGNTYTKARQQMLIDATYKLLAQDKAVNGELYRSNYLYDIVEFGGAVMADYAHYLLKTMGDAGINDANFATRRDAFLQIIRDMDTFRGTNLNFRLGKWTQEARAAAAEVVNAESATADWYEYNNARTILTTWSSPGTNLTDYSYRSWQGLLKDFYLPRWEAYFAANCADNLEYKFFEWNWAHGLTHKVGDTGISTTKLTKGQQGHTDSYTRDPEGNTVEEANKMLAKYIIPVKMTDGTYYAYRYLTNDLSAKCTVIATAGSTIDLGAYFSNLADATITGDFIVNGSSTDFNALQVKSDAADGAHTGTITMNDGTVITFAVVINPAFNGVYKLHVLQGTTGNYYAINKDVFVAYNDDKTDNPKSEGYKLLVEEDYSANAVADKYFTIIPSSTGFSLQAQGMYVKAPQDLSGWGHILCSENSGDAGVYLIEEPETDVFAFKSLAGDGKRYINAFNTESCKYIIGNDDKFSKFSITKVTTYTLTIPAGGATTLCLPFNVVLPEGVEAYDVTAVGNDVNGVVVYETELLAAKGEKIKAGTPVIVKGAAGDYTLGVTVDNAGAKGALAGSVLRGNFLSQTLVPGNSISKYTFSDNVFNLLSAQVEFPANSAWMESAEAVNTPIAVGKVVKPDLLGELIVKLGELIEKLAVVTPATTEKLSLTTDENGSYYIWCNAATANDGVGNLLDDNDGTILHTEWNAGAVSPGEHYLAVDLGAGNELSNFVFRYKARTGTKDDMNMADIPSRIDVYGCNEKDGEYVLLSSITDLEQTSGFEYQSAAINSNTPYRYLRFNVFANNGYWHMARFDLYKVIPTSADVAKEYEIVNGITGTEVAAAYDAMMDASSVHQNGTDDEKDAAYDALKSIYDALNKKLKAKALALPELGKVYRIKNYTVNTPDEYKYHYLVNSNVSIAFPTSVEDDDKSAMWVCTGANADTYKYTFASALGTAAFGWKGAEEDAVGYTITKGTIDGTVTFVNDENISLALTTEAWENKGNVAFNQASNGVKTQSEHWSTDWYLEEVENPGVSFTASINKGNKWATMYLPYAVAIPDGVDVFYAEENALDGERNIIDLTSIESTIPARTAVLLRREGDTPSTEATARFKFALAEDVAPFASNLFKGKIMQTAIDARDARVYLLVNYNKEAFYWMADEYNENCVFAGSDAGYVKCDANKGYLKLSNLQGASSYSFRFDGTTGIEDVKTENGEVKAIYDLQGRKLTEITKPGIYIVDGEKVLVK